MAHILLVEDEPELSRLVAEQLGEAGHRVDAAERGDLAFELARARHYDLLIIDRVLPGMDGLTLVKELRAGREEAPVLFVSSLGTCNGRFRLKASWPAAVIRN